MIWSISTLTIGLIIILAWSVHLWLCVSELEYRLDGMTTDRNLFRDRASMYANANSKLGIENIASERQSKTLEKQLIDIRKDYFIIARILIEARGILYKTNQMSLSEHPLGIPSNESKQS